MQPTSARSDAFEANRQQLARDSRVGAGVAPLAAFLALVWVLGGVGGVLGISGYLWATNCLGYHDNEAFAPLHPADRKNFLRLHIGPDGALTVYPVGIERVGRRWRFYPEASAGAPWLAPEGPEPGPHLIEPPITCGAAAAAHRESGIQPAPSSPPGVIRGTGRRRTISARLDARSH